MTDLAALRAQVAPAARALLEGSPIADDESQLKQLVGLDARAQETLLRSHINMGKDWDQALRDLPSVLPSKPADPVATPSEIESHDEQITPHLVDVDDNPFDTPEDAEALDDTPEAIMAELEHDDPEPRQTYHIERWRVDSLKPNKFNQVLFPDSLTDEAIVPLAEDIKERGQLEPVMADADGNLHNGERRCRALGLLGQDMVDVRIVPRKSDPELLDCVIKGVTSTRQMSAREQVNVYQAFQQLLRDRGGRGPGRPSKKPLSRDKGFLTPEQIQEVAAKEAKFGSVSTAERAVAVFTRGSEGLQRKVLDGEISIGEAYKETPRRKRRSSRTSEAGLTAQVTTNAATTDQEDAWEKTEAGGVVRGNTIEASRVGAQDAQANRCDEAEDGGNGDATEGGDEVVEDQAVDDDHEDTDDESEAQEDDDATAEDEDNEDDEQPPAFGELIDLACDHIEQTRKGSRGDGLTRFERYELAKSDVDHGIERLQAALGEDPDEEENFSEEPEQDDDAEFVALGL